MLLKPDHSHKHFRTESHSSIESMDGPPAKKLSAGYLQGYGGFNAKASNLALKHGKPSPYTAIKPKGASKLPMAISFGKKHCVLFVPDPTLITSTIDNGMPIDQTLLDLAEQDGNIRYPQLYRTDEADHIEHTILKEFKGLIVPAKFTWATLSRKRTFLISSEYGKSGTGYKLSNIFAGQPFAMIYPHLAQGDEAFRQRFQDARQRPPSPSPSPLEEVPQPGLDWEEPVRPQSPLPPQPVEQCSLCTQVFKAQHMRLHTLYCEQRAEQVRLMKSELWELANGLDSRLTRNLCYLHPLM